jgi:hypothetical protein
VQLLNCIGILINGELGKHTFRMLRNPISAREMRQCVVCGWERAVLAGFFEDNHDWSHTNYVSDVFAIEGRGQESGLEGGAEHDED